VAPAPAQSAAHCSSADYDPEQEKIVMKPNSMKEHKNARGTH
jgi:hypothetical protein